MGTSVCDISSSGTIRVSGSDARRFLTTMYSGDVPAADAALAVGEGLFLNAEGQVIDAVQVLRMGDGEFVVVGSAENADELLEWLEAHAEIEDDDGRVFEDLALEDVGALLALLVVFGDGAADTYADILEACEGRIAVMGVPYGDRTPYGVPDAPAYLLVAPVNAAASIGDFVVGELGATVCSYEEYVDLLQAQGAYSSDLYGAEYVKPAQAGLEGLLRHGGGFVGARALGL